MIEGIINSLIQANESANPDAIRLRSLQPEVSKYSLRMLENWQPRSKTSHDRNVDSLFQVIDFFCGCGGMSVGFDAISSRLPLFEIIGGCDISPASATTFSENFNVSAIVRDIRDFARDPNLLREYLESLPNYQEGRPTVLIGCAPCQGFTTHRKKNWHKHDARNSLVEDFATIAAHIQPECVVMENVPELLSIKYWEHFSAAKETLEQANYVVKQSIYNTADFGVPQDRYRALVVAMRQNFTLPEPIFGAGEYKTVRDAIQHLPAVPPGVAHHSDPLHRSAAHRPTTLDTIRAVPKNGGSRPTGVGPKCLDKTKGFSDVYGRLKWDKPSITITHYARNPASGRFVHPEQDRGLTLREAALLQSFPVSYKFTGSFDEMFRQVGEAVPPAFSAGIAASVLIEFLDPLDPSEEISSGQPVIAEPVSSSFSSVIVGLKAARDRLCDTQR